MTTPTQAEIIKLNLGDTIPVGQILTNMILMGIVTDPLNPNLFAATLQAFQSQSVLTIPVLQGPPGSPGQPSFALRFMNQDYTDPSQLPTDLGNTDADLGKFWIFGVQDENGNIVATTMYIWFGTSIGYRSLPVGAPGPPGPYPLITPNIILEEPNSGNGPGGVDSWIHVDGPVSNPVFTFHIAAPQGIPGPRAALASSPDVDLVTHVPQAGDLLQFSARVTPGAPTGLTATPSTTGGTFAAGSYFWKVTATMPNGETTGSNEATATLTGTTSSVALSWSVPTGDGATGYKIYRGTGIGAQDKLVAVITDGTTDSYVDTGSAGTPASILGSTLSAGQRVLVATPLEQIYPMPFTIPESAFTAQFGITAASPVTVLVFDCPKRNWPWKPWVTGRMEMFGVNFSPTPFLVVVEVRLGSASGPLVARGSGNNFGEVNMIPHTSDASNPNAAITPENAYALVPANHTGNTGKLYVNVVNQGMAGTFDINTANSILSLLQLPVPQ